MEAFPMKYICVFGVLLFLGVGRYGAVSNGRPWKVEGAGECGKSSADSEAFKLIPCAGAAMDANAAPSRSCCTQVKKIGQTPACLCAVMLSNTAKNSGIKPEIAMTIPKRCNIVDRPIGYQCGAYTLP